MNTDCSLSTPATGDSRNKRPRLSVPSAPESTAQNEADQFQRAREEIDRLRRLIPERPDFHLNLWGAWRRGYVGVDGYAAKSTCLEGLGGIASPDASDHVYERESGRWAEIADCCIDALPFDLRMAVCHVYEASVMQFRSAALLESNLIEAARRFWIDASRRGLV